MFVSHQWAGCDHPDPYFSQFKVLQDALRNVMEGSSLISGTAFELYTGQQSLISAEDLCSMPLFIWYDYFSCPQSFHGEQSRLMAIDSIPAYVERCRFFVALCPPIRHKTIDTVLNKQTWSKRGWCRLERAARELSGLADTKNIEIQGARQLAVAPIFDWVWAPVGEGHFSVAQDREKIASVVRSMVFRKLHINLLQGNWHSYRLMLNLQRIQYRSLAIVPIEDVIPGFKSDASDPAAYATAKFMYQNGFQSLDERTPEGWSPICFAAVEGNAMLLSTLIEMRADPNDLVQQSEPVLLLAPQTPLLHICAALSHNEALQVLLAARADIGSTDGFGSTALLWAAAVNNVEGIEILSQAGCDFKSPNMVGYSPFVAASVVGCIEAMTKLLPHASQHELNLALHKTILHGSGSADVMLILVNAGADVNCQLHTPLISPFGILFSMLSIRNHWRQSTLSYYAYHHYAATPLMCSVITGSFEATAVLLSAGACTEFRNARGCTVLDLARESCAPE
ncbi:ANKHD1, partial [Symbiodinium sp. CCMP2456]